MNENGLQQAVKEAYSRASRTGFDWFVVLLPTGYEAVSEYALGDHKVVSHIKASKLPRPSTRHLASEYKRAFLKLLKRPFNK